MTKHRLATVLLCSALGAIAFPAVAQELTPHRAVYDLRLGEATSQANISGLSGRMVYELAGSECDGYTVNFRFVTDIADSEGSTSVTDVRTTTFEAPEGDEFEFLTHTYRDEILMSEVRGSAARDGEDIVVNVAAPEEGEVRLEGPVVFPVAHMVELIEMAKAGERIFLSDVFDGSETGDQVYQTTSVIGRSDTVGADKDGELMPDSLEGLAVWPVSVAYFARDAVGEATPEYQTDFLLYENGVSRALKMNYGEFMLVGTLASYEDVEAAPCE